MHHLALLGPRPGRTPGSGGVPDPAGRLGSARRAANRRGPGWGGLGRAVGCVRARTVTDEFPDGRIASAWEKSPSPE